MQLTDVWSPPDASLRQWAYPDAGYQEDEALLAALRPLTRFRQLRAAMRQLFPPPLSLRQGRHRSRGHRSERPRVHWRQRAWRVDGDSTAVDKFMSEAAVRTQSIRFKRESLSFELLRQGWCFECCFVAEGRAVGWVWCWAASAGMRWANLSSLLAAPCLSPLQPRTSSCWAGRAAGSGRRACCSRCARAQSLAASRAAPRSARAAGGAHPWRWTLVCAGEMAHECR